jgi:predicted TIM-barrel fold metal-dependent hydrolase
MQPEDLEIVDAHHHLWDLKNHYPWLSDQPEPDFLLGDYTALKRDYLPEDYRLDAYRLKVVATVHIDAEYDRARPVEETAWLHQIHDQFGMPNAVVAHAFLHSNNLDETLAAHQKYPLVRGVRSKPVTSRSATDARPDGPGSMRDPNWRRGMKALERHDLSWDLRVPFWHLEEAASLLEKFSELRVALNHTGLPWDRSEEGLKVWRAGMRALAALPNVYCKISELGLKHAAWTVNGNRRVVLEAIEIFGVGRCMFGSNFPVAGLRVGYRAQVAGLLKILSGFSGLDLHKVFKENALRFYRIAPLSVDARTRLA